MTNRIELEAKTFSGKCRKELATLFPNATNYKKRHVAGVGYVWFIRDEDQKTLCKVYSEDGKMFAHA